MDIATATTNPETDASRYTMAEIEEIVRIHAATDAQDDDTILQRFFEEYMRIKDVASNRPDPSRYGHDYERH